MHVIVTLFGATAEAVGARHADTDVPEGTTVEALIRHLAAGYPGLRALLPAAGGELAEYFTLVVGGNLVSPDHVLRPADEVVVLLPVSGG